MAKIKVGQVAPLFELSDQTGKIHSLSQYRGNWVLLYFYPKDNTLGCTKEACSIRDNFTGFTDLRAVVLGISVDSVDSHKKFADKFKLPFALLSDSQKEVVVEYGAWGKKEFMGRQYLGTKRISFLIDPVGKIFKIYDTIKPAEHAEQVLNDLAEV